MAPRILKLNRRGLAQSSRTLLTYRLTPSWKANRLHRRVQFHYVLGKQSQTSTSERMAKKSISNSNYVYQDRLPTPPEPLRSDNDHPHPLRANPTSGPLKERRKDNAASRRMPVNPPSSPVMLDEPRSPSPSPQSTQRRSHSPLSPPVTPPPTASLKTGETAFIFTKRLMKSKKLSSSVHGMRR